MGVVYTILLPLILFIAAVAFISPLIALVCLLAAAFSVVVLVIAARRMLRARRDWVRVAGAVLIPVAGLTALAFAIVAGVSIMVAVNFYGSLLSQ